VPLRENSFYEKLSVISLTFKVVSPTKSVYCKLRSKQWFLTFLLGALRQIVGTWAHLGVQRAVNVRLKTMCLRRPTVKSLIIKFLIVLTTQWQVQNI
jgi:hypothetical protein